MARDIQDRPSLIDKATAVLADKACHMRCFFWAVKTARQDSPSSVISRHQPPPSPIPQTPFQCAAKSAPGSTTKRLSAAPAARVRLTIWQVRRARLLDVWDQLHKFYIEDVGSVDFCVPVSVKVCSSSQGKQGPFSLCFPFADFHATQWALCCRGRAQRWTGIRTPPQSRSQVVSMGHWPPQQWGST